MSDLNKKNINYGALNRFYQDLKSHDISTLNDRIDNIDIPEYTAGDGIAIDSSSMTISCIVKPIADVSVLPDAEAYKDSVLRLNGDEQVYISKATPITPTDRLPDNEQIGKAFIQETGTDSGEGSIYLGKYTLTCADGVLEYYGWSDGDLNRGLNITKENAENIDYETAQYLFISDNNWTNITTSGATTTLTVSEVDSSFMALTTDNVGIGVAQYTVPESVQIGNAYIVTGYDDKYIYTGEQVTFEYNSETKTGYKWVKVDNSFEPIADYFRITEDKAEDLVWFDTGGDECYTGCYIYDSTNGTITTRTNEYMIRTIFRNAPDSEQVGHATIEEDYLTRTVVYTGEEVIFEYNNEQITGYKWFDVNNPDSPIYSTKRAYQIYNTNNDSDDVHFYIDEGNITELTFENGDLLSISTVKYQRSSDWQWQRVVTEDELNALEARIAALENPNA